MNDSARVTTSDQAWDSGELGRDAKHARAESVDESKIDDVLELQLISVRLQKSLIDGLKLIAQANGIGYQPLMRQVLKRFVDSELRRMLREGYLQRPPEGAASGQKKHPLPAPTRARARKAA